jgi:acetyl-CoA carboxylase biotin carboxyl carrier protein
MPISHAGRIAAWLAGTDIELLELRGPAGHLTLRQIGGGVTIGTDEPALPHGAGDGLTVSAPSVGVFLHRHPLHETPLVRTGDAVQAGQVIGLLRIGPLLLPVTAPRPGKIVGMWAAHDTIVGFGTPLVELIATQGAGDHGHRFER